AAAWRGSPLTETSSTLASTTTAIKDAVDSQAPGVPCALARRHRPRGDPPSVQLAGPAPRGLPSGVGLGSSAARSNPCERTHARERQARHPDDAPPLRVARSPSALAGALSPSSFSCADCSIHAAGCTPSPVPASARNRIDIGVLSSPL